MAETPIPQAGKEKMGMKASSIKDFLPKGEAGSRQCYESAFGIMLCCLRQRKDLWL